MADDPTKPILDPVKVPDTVKADAWEAYNRATDKNSFQQSFDRINIPQEVKAQLWEAKFGGQKESAPEPMQVAVSHTPKIDGMQPVASHAPAIQQPKYAQPGPVARTVAKLGQMAETTPEMPLTRRIGGGITRGVVGFAGFVPQVVEGAITPPMNEAEAEAEQKLGGPNNLGGLALATHRAKGMLIDPMQAEAAKAREDQAKGNTASMAVHAAASGVPMIGPIAGNLYERARGGDWAGAGSEAATLAVLPSVEKLKAAPFSAPEISRSAEFMPPEGTLARTVAELPAKTAQTVADLARPVTERIAQRRTATRASNLSSALEMGGQPAKGTATFEDIGTPIIDDLRAEAAAQGKKPSDFNGRNGYKAAQELTQGVRKRFNDAYQNLIDPIKDDNATFAARAAARNAVGDLLSDARLLDEIQKGDPNARNVQTLTNIVGAIENAKTIGEMDALRIKLNELASKYYGKSEGQQYGSPYTQQALAGAADSIRNALYDEMAQRYTPGEGTVTDQNGNQIPVIQGEGITAEQIRDLQHKHGAAIQADQMMQNTARQISSVASNEAAPPSFAKLLARLGYRATLKSPAHATAGVVEKLFSGSDVDLFNKRMSRVVKGADAGSGTKFPTPPPFEGEYVETPETPNQQPPSVNSTYGPTFTQPQLPGGQPVLPARPVQPTRALPPLTLPESNAPIPKNLEAVGIPETAEASALQNAVRQGRGAERIAVPEPSRMAAVSPAVERQISRVPRVGERVERVAERAITGAKKAVPQRLEVDHSLSSTAPATEQVGSLPQSGTSAETPVHGTSSQNIASILKNGLQSQERVDGGVRNFDNKIYFANGSAGATDYAIRRVGDNGNAALVFIKPEYAATLRKTADRVTGDSFYTSDGNVPPEAIDHIEEWSVKNNALDKLVKTHEPAAVQSEPVAPKQGAGDKSTQPKQETPAGANVNVENPQKGMRFYHSRVLDTQKFDGKTPQLYEVTKVANGAVYYRPVYDYGNGHIELGKSEFIATDKFSKVVNAKYSTETTASDTTPPPSTAGHSLNSSAPEGTANGSLPTQSKAALKDGVDGLTWKQVQDYISQSVAHQKEVTINPKYRAAALAMINEGKLRIVSDGPEGTVVSAASTQPIASRVGTRGEASTRGAIQTKRSGDVSASSLEPVQQATAGQPEPAVSSQQSVAPKPKRAIRKQAASEAPQVAAEREAVAPQDLVKEDSDTPVTKDSEIAAMIQDPKKLEAAQKRLEELNSKASRYGYNPQGRDSVREQERQNLRAQIDEAKAAVERSKYPTIKPPEGTPLPVRNSQNKWEYRGEYFKAALQQVKDAWQKRWPDGGDGKSFTWDDFTKKYSHMADGEAPRPDEYKQEFLRVEVPGDGKFLIKNNPANIERLMREIPRTFDVKQPKPWKGPTPFREPKATEADRSKWVDTLRKELDDVQSRTGEYETRYGHEPEAKGLEDTPENRDKYQGYQWVHRSGTGHWNSDTAEYEGGKYDVYPKTREFTQAELDQRSREIRQELADMGVGGEQEVRDAANRMSNGLLYKANTDANKVVLAHERRVISDADAMAMLKWIEENGKARDGRYNDEGYRGFDGMAEDLGVDKPEIDRRENDINKLGVLKGKSYSSKGQKWEWNKKADIPERPTESILGTAKTEETQPADRIALSRARIAKRTIAHREQ